MGRSSRNNFYLRLSSDDLPQRKPPGDLYWNMAVMKIWCMLNFTKNNDDDDDDEHYDDDDDNNNNNNNNNNNDKIKSFCRVSF